MEFLGALFKLIFHKSLFTELFVSLVFPHFTFIHFHREFYSTTNKTKINYRKKPQNFNIHGNPF